MKNEIDKNKNTTEDIIGITAEAVKKIVMEKKQIDEISLREILPTVGDISTYRVLSHGSANILDKAIDKLIELGIVCISGWENVPLEKMRKFKETKVPILSLAPKQKRRQLQLAELQ